MPSITKRVHTLADGREFIYFDDADTASHRTARPTCVILKPARRPRPCARIR